MNHLMQPLKLQLRSSILPFVINFVLAVIFIILVKVLNNSLEYYLMLFVCEILFTFFFGLFNFNTLGHTYSSLKHDKHSFCLSSFIINVINACIIIIVFVIACLFMYSKANVFSIVVYFSIQLLAFTLGNTYSLFLAKNRLTNIITFIIVTSLSLLLGKYIMNGFNEFFDKLFNNDFYLVGLIVMIISVVLTICLDIINNMKYRKE